MDAGQLLRSARLRAGLTQAALAARAGTSQAAVSAYEGERKDLSAGTLIRLLAAAGARLNAVPRERSVVVGTEADLARAGRRLVEVMALAEALPTRHARTLTFPRLDLRAP